MYLAQHTEPRRNKLDTDQPLQVVDSTEEDFEMAQGWYQRCHHHSPCTYFEHQSIAQTFLVCCHGLRREPCTISTTRWQRCDVSIGSASVFDKALERQDIVYLSCNEASVSGVTTVGTLVQAPVHVAFTAFSARLYEQCSKISALCHGKTLCEAPIVSFF